MRKQLIPGPLSEEVRPGIEANGVYDKVGGNVVKQNARLNLMHLMLKLR